MPCVQYDLLQSTQFDKHPGLVVNGSEKSFVNNKSSAAK
jgi:hypothetical protein